jgi:protein-arginine kinase activator protein McsA
MIGRNPLNVSYYNPLGRTAKSWTDDKKRAAAIEQLKTELVTLVDAGETEEANVIASRMRQLGATDDEIGVANLETA